jgi:ligand-binding sensor domain-containing protein/signal transduction histidine kinase
MDRNTGRTASFLAAPFLILTLLLLYPFSAYSLDPSKRLTQYSYETFQASDGLPHGAVRSITQSRDGYLWIGTERGLARFDGVKFTLFSQKNVPEMTYFGVRTLFPADDGTLWFADGGTLLKRDKDGTIRKPGFKFPSGLNHRHTITGINMDRSGSLWVGHSGFGLFRIKNGNVTHFTKTEGVGSDVILTLGKDSEGRIWIGTDKGASYFSNELFTAVPINGLAEARVSSFFNTKDGRLWAIANRNLYYYKDNKFLDLKIGLNSPVTSICSDKHNNLWIGTDKGLFRFRDGEISDARNQNLLPDNMISFLFEDREGNLWVCTRRGGLAVIRDTKLTNFSITEGLPHDYVNAIHEDRDGTLWVGTRGGLVNLYKGNIRTITTRDGLQSDYIRSLWRDSRGRLWIGTSGSGIQYFENGRIYRLNPKPNQFLDIISISETPDGRVWFGTNQNNLLFYFTNNQITEFGEITSNPLATTRVLSRDPDGSILIGTGAGLYRLAGERISSVIDGLEFPAVSVRSLYRDNEGDLWIGTSSVGLYRIHKQKLKFYTEKQGLYDNGITQIQIDLKGNLWLGSRAGIFRINRKNFDLLDQGSIGRLSYTAYDSSSGILEWKCVLDGRYTGIEEPHAKLYFPTDRGMIMVDTEQLAEISLPPVVHIEEVRSGNRVVENRTIPPGRGDLEIHYTGLNFTAPEKIRFRYMLEGFDQSWMEADTRRVAYYTNLPHGNYRFRVLAANNDGVWNSQGATLELYIKPYFYQTYWFYLLCLACLISLALLAYRYRLKVMEAHYGSVIAERSRIAREIHDTILQGVAGMVFKLEAVKQTMVESPHSARESLDRILQEADKSMAEMRKSIWDIRTRSTERENLTGKISKILKEQTSAYSINSSLKIEGAPRQLPQAVESNLLGVVQEALSNVVKHSNAQHVHVRLDLDPHYVMLSVEDDGKGFIAEEITARDHHFGILGMQERAELIGGRLTVQSRKGAGTQILIVVPLN